MKTTEETPADGVVVVQPARGYRYSADVFLLGGVALADGYPTRSIDLGTGCGVLPLLLARLGVRAVGVEVRREWAAYWERSLALSEVSAELRVQRVQELVDGGFDLVTCNPPYFPAGTGPISPDVLKASAHTELDGTLADFVSAAERVLSADGRVVFVVPRGRVKPLIQEFTGVGLRVWRRVDVGAKRSVVVAGRKSREIVERTIGARGMDVDALYDRLRG